MTMTIPQGFGPQPSERLSLPSPESMTPAQRAAADALTAGPRKGVKGPFIPLMHSPVLLERLAADDRLPLDYDDLQALMARPLEFTGAAASQVAAVVAQVDRIAGEYPDAAGYQPGAIL